MPAAARLTDSHSCPLSVPTAHVGGVIVGPGAGSVTIEHLPAAVEGSDCSCGLGPPNRIAKGSSSVVFEHKPAARVNDFTTHGGVITSGCASVVIG
jgi:uncharacterized Zn-binding protein involved in type VI secretion